VTIENLLSPSNECTLIAYLIAFLIR